MPLHEVAGTGATVAGMVRRGLAVLAAAGALAAGSGCRESTVSVAFRPEEGDRYRYRYEIELTMRREVEGEEPETRTLDETLTADQEVLELTGDGAQVEVELAREGGSARTAVVLLDRAGSLQGIQLVEDLEAGLFELTDADSLLATQPDSPPDRRLAPGDTWTIRDGERRGTGRLVRLGVIDDEDVAVVRTSTKEDLEDSVRAGASATDVHGTLRSGATTSYDLRDGALRRSRSWSRGRIDARLAPPAGVLAEPVDAQITYTSRCASRAPRDASRSRYWPAVLDGGVSFAMSGPRTTTTCAPLITPGCVVPSGWGTTVAGAPIAVARTAASRSKPGPYRICVAVTSDVASAPLASVRL